MQPESSLKPFELAKLFAGRERRAGMKSMRLMLVALVLGVAVITAIGMLRDSLFAGIEQDAQLILGGDVAMSRPYRPMSAYEREVVEQFGTLSSVLEMRTMASFEIGEQARRRLVELKAIDQHYPLYGALQLTPSMSVEEALGPKAMVDGTKRYGVAIGVGVSQILLAEVGDVIQIGTREYEIRAVIDREPDQLVNSYRLGPRVMMSEEGLIASGLVAPGSLVTYRYRLKLHEGKLAETAVVALNQKLPDAGFRITDYRDAAPRLEEMLDRLQSYIGIVGLAVLLTAGIGIANAVRGWLGGKLTIIATFKAIGATRQVVAYTYALQILAASALAIIAGLVLGSAMPPLLLPLLQDMLPVVPVWTISPMHLVYSALFGVLVVLGFSLWPLYRATTVKPAAIFRGVISDDLARPPLQSWHFIAYGALILVLTGLAALIIQSWKLTLAFAGCMVLAFILLTAIARALQSVGGMIQHKGGLSMRYALANLSRVGAPTMAVVMSLGMGTALMVAVLQIEHNMSRQLGDGVPDDAPSFFFVDIQKEQIASFRQIVEGVEGVEHVNIAPMLRGRILQINGVDAEEADVAPGSQWAVRGDRGLTFSATAPSNNDIVEGSWWDEDYRGDTLLSLSAEMAKDMNLSIGDTMTVDLMGTSVTATIANLREVNWRDYKMNFALIFSPGLMDALPYTYLATVKVPLASEDALMNNVSEAIANISIVRLRDALEDAARLIGNIAVMVKAVAIFALVMGLIVMMTAINATQQRRVFDHTLLKVLGAPRKVIIRILALEFAFTGLVSAFAAALLGGAAAAMVAHFVLKAHFVMNTTSLGITAFGAIAAIIALGLYSTWQTLRARPLQLLRNE